MTAPLYLDHKAQVDKNYQSDYFCEQLLTNSNAKMAREYLKSRNVSKDAILAFKIGYCSEQDAETANLHHLSNRIIFPIIDEFEDSLAFSGRTITEETPKWWHEHYQKSFFLYGLNETWKHIYDKNLAIIVEGQMDTTTVWQHDIKNVVGLMGTKFTKIHLSKLLMICNRFILMLDGDDAGQIGTEKAYELIKADRNMNYQCLKINLRTKKGACDPDSFLNEYPAEMLKSFMKRKWSEMAK